MNTLDAKNLFQGRLVRLTAEQPEVLSKGFSRWSRDSEYLRLLDMDPARPWSAKKFQEWNEKDLEKPQPNDIAFCIRSLQDDRLIGFICLAEIAWQHGDAWVGIGIGDRDDWSKGYGTDAMQIVLRYAFQELDLHRVSLGTFAYNPRAIRSYQKAGFVIEGYERQRLHRDGDFADCLIMGILRSEWQVVNGESA